MYFKWSMNRDREYKQNEFIPTWWKLTAVLVSDGQQSQQAMSLSHGRCDSRSTIQYFNKQFKSTPKFAVQEAKVESSPKVQAIKSIRF